MTAVRGNAAEGWGRVADAFASNFDAGHELGSACAVYADGKVVVDLCGGFADPRDGRRWDEDTVVVVFSTTKGATAICAHMLVERGELELDAPVARYWPEFAAAGKERLLVRWLLTHQAGLPAVDVDLTLDEVCAWEPMVRALEAQEPYWTPGEQHAYHAHTYGFLVGELVRRISGTSLGTMFAREIAIPLGLSTWIGLPEAIEPRVAHLTLPPPDPDLDLTPAYEAQGLDRETARELADNIRAILADPTSVEVRSGTLGTAFSSGLVTDDGGHNARVVHASELPGSGMVSDARSVARMYAATVGDVDGVRLLREDTVDQITAPQTSSSTPYSELPPDLLQRLGPLLEESRPHSLGFLRPSRLRPLLGPRSFGHDGAGGSLGFADPDAGIAFSYVMNLMSPEPRAQRLVAAVSACLS